MKITTKAIEILFLCLVMLSCKQKQDPINEHQPIDKQANKEVVELYNDLFTRMDTGVMIGHQDALAYGHDWYREDGRSDMKDVSGDYPAIVGWELGHLEIGADYNLDSVYFSDMKRYIKETHDRGGITAVSWHGDNIVTGNTAWDCDQDSVVRTILPNGVNHEKYLTWLDRLSAFFSDLKDDKGVPIPLIFRMYHENTGAWFWWGSKQCTPEEYKQLWKMTVDYLKDKKNVHNLLYAYSPASDATNESEFLQRYPGDDYVDIIGYDCYVSGTDTTAIKEYVETMDRNLQIVTTYANKSGKLPIIGETGFESIPSTTYFSETVYPLISKYKIAWVLFWRNAWSPTQRNHFYLPYKGQQSAEDFRKFTEFKNVLLNNDLKK